MSFGISKIYKDKHGNNTLFLKPNLPIIVWFVSYLLTKLLPYGQLNFVASLIAYGALFTWGWLELFQGTSIFRRSIGLVVLALLIHSHVG